MKDWIRKWKIARKENRITKMRQKERREEIKQGHNAVLPTMQDVDGVEIKPEYPWYQHKDMYKEVVDKFGVV